MENKFFKVFLIGGGILLIIGVLTFIIINTLKDKNMILDQKQREDLAEENKEANKDVFSKINMAGSKDLKPINESDHVWGDKNAPVQIIIYSDFECPFCARFSETIKKVKEEFNNKIVITFRHFPLRSHMQALPAALASECAAAQGKFWEMHDKLFQDNVMRKLNSEQFKKDAEDLGLNLEKFNQCLASEKYKEKIERQIEEGARAGVTGTPTSFVNGEILIGAIPFDDFTGQDGKQKEGIQSVIKKLLREN